MYVNKPVQWILWAPWNLEFGQLPVAPKRKLIDSNHQFSEKTAIVSGSHWLFKMFIHSLFFLDWSNVQWFSVTSHHNITTARKPCDINRFGAASSPPVKYKTPRPSYWFFSIRMSNYIHAITCIIIYMGILLMQIQTRNHWIIPPPKAPSPPNHSKKHPQDVFSNHHQKITESVPFRPAGSRADLVEVLSQKATQSYHKHLAGLEGGWLKFRDNTLPETNSSHLKVGRNPKGNNRIPIIRFQGIC